MALALLPLCALGPGCDDRADPTLIVRNEGLHWASVTVHTTFNSSDSDGTEFVDEDWITAELKPGHALTRCFSSVDSVHVTVARLGDGFVVLSESYDSGDFGGDDNELEIVVHP